jgi:hypothetical protein
MGIGRDLRLAGLNRNIEINGEAVTFRGTALNALVCRFPADEMPGGPGRVNLSARDSSKIDVKRTDLPAHRTNTDPLPTPGEVFTDEFGYKHRVIKARWLDLVAHCECEASS